MDKSKSKKGASVLKEFALFYWNIVEYIWPTIFQNKDYQYKASILDILFTTFINILFYVGRDAFTL